MNITENLSVVEIALGKESDFSLFQLLVEFKGKLYVKDVFVKYKDITVALNYPETLEFFSFLDSLVKKGLSSNDENPFFSYAQKNEKNNTLTRSLRFKQNQKLYISPATAKTMCQFYNESKIGLSFRNILRSKVVFSIETQLETTSKKAYFPTNESLESIINSQLDNNGITYDNTPYYSQKISKLLNVIKNKYK